MDTEALNAQQAITIRSYREENKGLKAALADFVAAAEPILNDFPTQEQWDAFEAKLERARKVMKEEC